jgi:hypothetical protein
MSKHIWFALVWLIYSSMCALAYHSSTGMEFFLGASVAGGVLVGMNAIAYWDTVYE